MDTYEVTIGRKQPKLKHKVLEVFLFAGAFFILRFSWTVLSPSQSERIRGLGSLAIEIGIVSLAWALCMVFLDPFWKGYDVKLVVAADSITAFYPIWRSRSLSRTVRKGKVRTIFQIKASSSQPGGIGISEKKGFAIRLRGYVYVPNSLPEFDKLKSLAESWRVSE